MAGYTVWFLNQPCIPGVNPLDHWFSSLVFVKDFVASMFIKDIGLEYFSGNVFVRI